MLEIMLNYLIRNEAAGAQERGLYVELAHKWNKS